jgi:hypothetical protein
MFSNFQARGFVRSICLGLAAFCVFLAGCNDAVLMKAFTPPEKEAAAKHYVDLLVHKDFDPIVHDLDPGLVDPSTPQTLAKMASFFPNESPTSIKVVGAHTFNVPGSSRVEIDLEYEFQHNWVLASVTTQTTEDGSKIISFHVNPMSSSLEERNRFTLRGKGRIQYFALLAAVLIQLFSLCVLVVCARTKNVPRKWLWIIFILFGFNKFWVNWATGEYGTMLVSFQVPCVMATRPLYGAWILSITIPWGAIFFMYWRGRHAAREESPATAPLIAAQPPTEPPM